MVACAGEISSKLLLAQQPPGRWPGTQPARMRRVSVLLGLPENDPETRARLRAFRLGMRDTGWVEGRNLQIEYRFAGTNLERHRHRFLSRRLLDGGLIVAGRSAKSNV